MIVARKTVQQLTGTHMPCRADTDAFQEQSELAVAEPKARKGLYLEMLEDFDATRKTAVIVKMPGKSDQTVYYGLKTALNTNRERFAHPERNRRDPVVYLVHDTGHRTGHTTVK